MLTLFWDIDGTLLTTAGAGTAAWREAAVKLGGDPAVLEGRVTAGLTDVQVANAIACHLPESSGSGRTLALIRHYEALLPEHLAQTAGRVLPGVREVLDDLHGRDDVALFLLTGNTRAGAAVKLVHYGLDQYFSDGAFSDETVDRTEVAVRALELAQARLGARFKRERAVVVGDTPHDIACARAVGVRALAVASHVYTTEQLAEHGPWAVLPALPPPAEFARCFGLAARVAPDVASAGNSV